MLHRWYDPAGRTGLWLAPFVWDRGLKNPDNGGFGILPVFSYDMTDGVRELLVAPYYQTRGPDQRTDVLFPIFWRKQSPDERWHSLVPVYGWSQREHASGETTTSSWLLLWAYSRTETRGPGGERLQRRRRFLFFSDERHRDGSRVFRILGIPIVERMPAR